MHQDMPHVEQALQHSTREERSKQAQWVLVQEERERRIEAGSTKYFRHER